MGLSLDTRQRAMLQEMGVPVWLPAPLAADGAGDGVARAPQAAAAAPSRAAPSPVVAAPAAAVAAPAPVPPPAAPRSDGAALDWATLTQTVHACQACGLCAGRSHSTLLAPSSAVACDWMVVGDPPDAEEDRAGAPFAGADGVLLDQMLRALGLQRANPVAAAAPPDAAPAQRAYITQVVKCRPAHGAIPQAEELARCSAYLRQEIALVRPRVILALGRFANQVLLAETPELAGQALGKLRGRVYHYAGVPVVLSYQPKLLMRNGADKAKAWADLCLAASLLP